MAVSFTIFSIVDGESISRAFPVKVSPDDTVGDLKKLIKAEKTVQFNDVDADQLVLWHVSIPIVDADVESQVLLDAQPEKTRPPPTKRLTKLFLESVPEDTVHILVQRPPPVSGSIRLTVFLHTYPRAKFVWTTDANTATLQQLRTSIDSAFPGRLDGTETITVQHILTSGDYMQTREPVGSDEQLQRILWFNLRAGIHKLVVDLETQLRNVESYTIADVNKLYDLTSFRQPVLADLPTLAPMGRTQLNSGKRKRALEQLSEELDARKKVRRHRLDSGGLCNLTYSFLVRAVTLFDELILDEKKLIQGPRGQGLIDYAIMSRRDPSHIMAITHIKMDQGIENGVAQNMVHLETILRERARIRSTEDTAPLTSFGIVTNAQEWHFVKCKLDPRTDSAPTFHTSTLPDIAIYSSKEWRTNIESIFGHIVWLLDDMFCPKSTNDIDVKESCE